MEIYKLCLAPSILIDTTVTIDTNAPYPLCFVLDSYSVWRTSYAVIFERKKHGRELGHCGTAATGMLCLFKSV